MDLHWRPSEAARILDVEQITVRRWSCGLSPVPPAVASWLRPLAEGMRGLMAQHPAPPVRRGAQPRPPAQSGTAGPPEERAR